MRIRPTLPIVSVTLAAVLVPANAARGQAPAPTPSFIEHEVLGRGFDPTKAYTGADIDRVNTFNGNLTLAVPLGPAYRLDGGFAYGLTLHYNVQAWDFEQERMPSDRQTECDIFATATIPMPNANAGHGWRLSLGELYAPRPDPETWGPNRSEHRFLFVAPDGSRHHFQQAIHPDPASDDGDATVLFSSDGTFLRLRLSVENGQEIATVDQPDGPSLRFRMVDGLAFGGAGRYRLERLFDDAHRDAAGLPFNKVDITYPDELPDPGNPTVILDDGDTWLLTDSYLRQHTVTFEAGGPYLARRVASVRLLGHGGVPLDFTFVYASRQIARTRGHEIDWPESEHDGQSIAGVSLLEGLVLPDTGSGAPSYAFSYFHPGAPHGTIGPRNAGQLRSVALPTGGRIAYTYQEYLFPLPLDIGQCQGGEPEGPFCPSPDVFHSVTAGIATRTVRDCIANGCAGPDDPTPARSWYYYQRGVDDPMDLCAQSREVSTTVFDPDGAARVFHYSAWVSGDDTTPYDTDQGGGTGEVWRDDEAGMPFTRLDYRPGLRPSDPPLYRSSALWDCKGLFDPATHTRDDLPEAIGCTEKQATFVRYQGTFSDVDCLQDGSLAYHCTDTGARVIARRTETYESVGPGEEPDLDCDGTPDDGETRRAMIVDRRFELWDGLGHHRRAVTTANWTGPHGPFCGAPGTAHIDQWETKVEVTDYNRAPDSGHVGAAGPTWYPAKDDPWVLGRFTRRSVQETVGYDTATGALDVDPPQLGSSAKIVADYCFDETTGDLLGVRRRAAVRSQVQSPPSHDLSDPAPSAADTLAVYRYDLDANGQTVPNRGNRLRDGYHGGERGAATNSASGCAVPAGAPTYELVHTYERGTLERTTVRDGAETFALVVADNTAIDPSSGLVTASATPSGLVATAVYDALGRLIRLVPPGDLPIDYAYDDHAAGTTPAEVRSTQGDTERIIHFDGFGRAFRDRNRLPDGTLNEQVTRYTAVGHLASVSTVGPVGLGAVAEHRNHDVFGRPRKVVRPDGGWTDLEYTGNRVTRVTTYALAALPDPGDPDPPFPQTGSNRWQYLDPYGRLARVQEDADPGEPGAESTRYHYDVGGHLAVVHVRRPGGQNRTRWLDFDGRGFLIKEKHPEIDGLVRHVGAAAVDGYDAVGQPGSRRIGDGSAFSLRFTYDPLGRLTAVRDQAHGGRLVEELRWADRNANTGEPFPFSLLRRGQLFQAKRHNWLPTAGGDVDVVVTETFDYGDADPADPADTESGRLAGRVVQTSLGPGFQAAFGYDGLGKLGRVDYPCGPDRFCNPGHPRRAPRQVDFAYTRGFLARATTDSGYQSAPFDVVPSVTYHPNGTIERLETASGVAFRQGAFATYEPRPSFVGTDGATGSATGNVGDWNSGPIRYDFSGNVMAAGITGKQDQYAYDPVGRLVAARVRHPSATGIATREVDYAYDRFGNLTQRVDSVLGTLDLAVEETTNRLAGVPYDVAGNQLEMAGIAVTYDALNMPVTMGQAPGVNKAFVYGPGNERLVSIDHAAPGGRRDAWTMRDAGNQLLQTWTWHEDDGWTARKDYVRRGGAVVATFDDRDGAPLRTRYLFPDHLGTPRLITDETGDAVAYREYTPFGREITFNPQVDETVQFTGHERDRNCEGCAHAADDDLDYMHARYYQPQIGRFASVDPVLGTVERPQSWNRYSYVMNSPLTLVDPAGLRASCIGRDKENAAQDPSCQEVDPIEDRPPPDVIDEFDPLDYVDPQFLPGFTFLAKSKGILEANVYVGFDTDIISEEFWQSTAVSEFQVNLNVKVLDVGIEAGVAATPAFVPVTVTKENPLGLGLALRNPNGTCCFDLSPSFGSVDTDVAAGDISVGTGPLGVGLRVGNYISDLIGATTRYLDEVRRNAYVGPRGYYGE